MRIDARTTRRTAIAALVSLAAVLPVSAAATAPAPEPAVSEEISVQLVNVEVHVTGADGRPIPDLRREEFHLFEDGKPVELTHFAWVPARAEGEGSARGGANPAPAPPRQIAIFVDEMQIGEHGRKPLVDALRSQLARSLGPDDEVAIVRFNGAELEQLLPWTSDRAKRERALAELSGFSLQRLALSNELKSYLDWMRRDIYDNTGKDNGTVCANVGLIARTYADVVRRHVEASGSALLRYAQRLAHESSSRTLFHVSDGIPLVAGGEVFQLAVEMCSGKAMQEGVPQAVSTSVADPSGEFQSDRFNPRAGALETFGYQMGSFWADVAARLNALGVTVYTIQAAEAGSRFLPEAEGQILPASVRAVAQENPVDTLALLARETGGVLVRAGRGADDEVARLFASLGDSYSLAFAPRPGRVQRREIRVEVDRPGAQLRYRKSYHLESRDERISGQLAELFEAGKLDNPLTLALDVRAGSEATQPRRLQVVVPFDRLSMIASPGGGEEGRFTVYVAVRPEGGRVSMPRQRSIVARRTDPSALAFIYEIALPDEEGDVAVAVADDYSGTVAFARERMRAH